MAGLWEGSESGITERLYGHFDGLLVGFRESKDASKARLETDGAYA